MFQNNAVDPRTFAHIGLHLIPNFEAQFLLRLALFKALNQSLLIQIAANKDESALAFLSRLPLDVRKAARKHHVNALHNFMHRYAYKYIDVHVHMYVHVHVHMPAYVRARTRVRVLRSCAM